MKEIKIKLLNEDAMEPYKGSEEAACYDLYATSVEYQHGGSIVKYGTGIAMELPKGTQLDIRPRSSVYKTGLMLSNAVGVIDSDYRGEIMVVFYNIIPSLEEYSVGDRICQVQLQTIEDIKFTMVSELEPSKRGIGGFGSTGK